MFQAHIISIVTCFICILLHLFTFSWTNLLTRCPVPVSSFLLFLFQKSYTGNILGIARDENPRPYIAVMYTDTKGETEGSHEAPTQPGGATPPPGVRAGCVGPTGLPWGHPFAHIYLFDGNPRYPIIIPRKVLSLPSSSTLDREGSGALPGTLPERRSSPEGSTSPCLPPV